MSVTLHTTQGDLKLELYCDRAPRVAYNFLSLCASNKYDGTKFLRNINSFLIQGGDTTGTGKGGECIWGGLMPDEFVGDLRHDTRGVISMASSKPDEIGSQFFITYGPQAHLDGKQSVVGKILFGWDCLDKMERVPVQGKKHRPTEDMSIINVTIHANPFADNGRIIPEPANLKPAKVIKKKKEKVISVTRQQDW